MRLRLILIPEGRGRTRSLWVDFRLVGLLGAGAVLGLLGLAWSLWVGGELAVLRSENKRLSWELAQREAALDSLEGSLSRLLETENRLRMALGMAREPKGILQVPMGGTDIPSRWRVERLLRLAQLELRGYRELDSVLTAKIDLARRVPSILPCPGVITSGFGYRRDPVWGGWEFHRGLDIAAPRGTPVRAPADGVVRFAGRKRGFGLCVEIDHGAGITTFYGHASRLNVKVGSRVRRGDVICYVGSTGKSTGPHLHYEIRINGKPVDPERFLGEAALQ